MSEQLSTHVKKRVAKAAQEAATSPVDSDIIDMAGFRGVEFFARVAVANAGNHLTVRASNDAAMANAVTLDLKAVCANANEILSVDVYRPKQRYVQARITRTASTASTAIYVQQYGPTRSPVDNNEAEKIVTSAGVSPAAAV